MIWNVGKYVFGLLCGLTILTALVASFCVLKPASFWGYGTCLIYALVLSVPFLCLFANGILFCKRKLEKPATCSKKRNRHRDHVSLDIAHSRR